MFKKVSVILKNRIGLRKKAQSLVEYGLILALVSIVAITVLNTMGQKITNTVTKINNELDRANAMVNGQ